MRAYCIEMQEDWKDDLNICLRSVSSFAWLHNGAAATYWGGRRAVLDYS